jgi:hypothetical protein
MKRENGLYWVKDTDETWSVAQYWEGDWNIIGEDDYWQHPDSEWLEIDENKLEYNEKPI